MGAPVKSNSLWLTMDDGAKVYVRVWEPSGGDGYRPRAVLQIAHGMTEHISRYDDFASFLASRGVAVVGDDHRGHGHTGEKADSIGYLADSNGFDRVVDDLRAINEWVGERWPGVPMFLMGHSMGSMLARRYIQQYASTVSGVILMATAGDPGFLGKLGRWLARLEMKRRGPRHPSMFLSALVFGGYNKKVPRPKTAFDWLSRDRAAVDAYVADPWCGFAPSAGFYFDLLTGLQLIHDDALVARIPKHMPLLFVTGDADPVGGYGKGVERVIAQYKRHGLRNIESITYPGARHELLNELNKDDVYRDIFAWLERRLEGLHSRPHFDKPPHVFTKEV